MYFKIKIITTFFLLFFYRISFSQNYLNINCDYNSTEVTNTYKNLYIADSLIFLTGQFTTETGIALYLEERSLNGDIHNIKAISDSVISYYSGDGKCFGRINSNFYCFGSATSPNSISNACFYKLNSNLDTLLLRRYNFSNSNWSRFFGHTRKDNFFYVLGDTKYLDSITNVKYLKGILTKIDTLGNIIWQQSLGNNITNLLLNGMKLNIDGSIYVYGSKFQTQSYRDFYLIKFDSLGNQVWQYVWGSQYHDAISDIYEMADGKLLVTGYTSVDHFGLQRYPAYISMLSADGSQRLWEKQFFEFYGNESALTNIYKASSGNYQIWGWNTDLYKDITRPFLMTFSSSFDSLDLQYYSYWNGSGAQNYIRDIVRMPDNGYMACGFGWDDNHGEDGWLLRIDSNGCANVNCTPLAIQETKEENDKLVVYPNPASDVLNIETDSMFANTKPITVTISSYTGQVVFQSSSPLGRLGGAYTIDVSNLPNGLYIVKLQTKSGEALSKRVLIQK
jgi:hypothetical protein